MYSFFQSKRVDTALERPTAKTPVRRPETMVMRNLAKVWPV
jgi:hypothetical protein